MATWSLRGSFSSTWPGRATGPSVSSETTPECASTIASSRNSLRLRNSEFDQYQCPQITAGNGPLAIGNKKIGRHAATLGAGVRNVVNGDIAAAVDAGFLDFEESSMVVVER